MKIKNRDVLDYPNFVMWVVKDDLVFFISKQKSVDPIIKIEKGVEEVIPYLDRIRDLNFEVLFDFLKGHFQIWVQQGDGTLLTEHLAQNFGVSRKFRRKIPIRNLMPKDVPQKMEDRWKADIEWRLPFFQERFEYLPVVLGFKVDRFLKDYDFAINEASEKLFREKVDRLLQEVSELEPEDGLSQRKLFQPNLQIPDLFLIRIDIEELERQILNIVQDHLSYPYLDEVDIKEAREDLFALLDQSSLEAYHLFRDFFTEGIGISSLLHFVSKKFDLNINHRNLFYIAEKKET
ncbi:MAG: hypothetical protein AAGM67_00380 [Bacteroidota bacterium]